jgi:GAF domain-containing protein
MAAGSKASMISGTFRGAQEALLELLLQFPATVDPHEDLGALVSRFCRAVRNIFAASGAYCWLLDEGNGLKGFAADGLQAATFPGLRMSLDQPSLARQALESGRAAFVNEVDRDPSSRAPGAILAVPLLAMSRPTGVLILTHHEPEREFDVDIASAVLVLGAHLGAVISNARLAHALALERRRNESLIEAAESFNIRNGLPAVKHSRLTLPWWCGRTWKASRWMRFQAPGVFPNRRRSPDSSLNWRRERWWLSIHSSGARRTTNRCCAGR